MSDNAETVIFNILRGSGARGASGITPLRENIIRPLIKISKKDIDSSLSAFGIPFVIDSTNLSDDYTRNYIRHEVIPGFERITNDPERSLMRFSENMRSDDSFIMGFADDFLSNREVLTNKDLLELHYSVYIRVLTILADKKGAGISSKIASDIHSLLKKDNFSYSLIGGYVFICERGVCRIASNIGNLYNFCFEVKEGITDLSPLNADFVVYKEKTYSNIYKISIQDRIPFDIIDGEIYIRSREAGDTIFYNGITHKIKKMFCDRKIPNSKKDLIPVFCDNRGPLLVPGYHARGDVRAADKYLYVYVLDECYDTENRFFTGRDFV
jgi:tRNA(Ile)-lysidine synthase